MAQLHPPFTRSLVALSALACLLGGCGGDDDDDNVPAPVRQATAFEPPPAVQPCGRTGARPGDAFDRARYGIVGHWVGTATPSFVSDPWPVEITFRPDGTYTAVRYGEKQASGPLYYGEAPGGSAAGTYELLDLTDNGEAWGEIGVPFGDDRLLVGDIARVALDEPLGSLRFVFVPSWLTSGASPRITYELSCVPEPEPRPSVTPARR